jgi:hypothetical protein
MTRCTCAADVCCDWHTGHGSSMRSIRSNEAGFLARVAQEDENLATAKSAEMRTMSFFHSVDVRNGRREQRCARLDG